MSLSTVRQTFYTFGFPYDQVIQCASTSYERFPENSLATTKLLLSFLGLLNEEHPKFEEDAIILNDYVCPADENSGILTLTHVKHTKINRYALARFQKAAEQYLTHELNCVCVSEDFFIEEPQNNNSFAPVVA
jgi:hypothetical protein